MANLAPIKVVATASDNTTATGYFGLDSSFGSTPSNSGKSLFKPSGDTLSSAQPVSAVDTNQTDGTTGDVYTAKAYKPSGANDQFSVTRTTASGALDTQWGSNGTLAFSFDSFNDVPTCIAVSADGNYVIVGGTCNGKWGVAILETAFQEDTQTYGKLDQKTPLNFQSGHVNALALDATDGDCVVAGDDGNGNMAAGLLIPTFANGTWGFEWGSSPGSGHTWSAAVKSYSTGYQSSATSAVNDIDTDTGISEQAIEGVMVLGGNSIIGVCQENFTMIGINKSDGSTISAFGTNGVAMMNIGTTVGSCIGSGQPSWDSECSLVSWWGGNNYYLTECGGYQPSGYGSSNIKMAAIRYVCAVDPNNNDIITSVSPDTSFGQFSAGAAVATARIATPHSAVQDPSTGTIYMAGSDADSPYFYVYALDDTGNTASTFGVLGDMEIDLGSSGGNGGGTAYSIVEGPVSDGATPLVVTGSSNSSYGDVGIVELWQTSEPIPA